MQFCSFFRRIITHTLNLKVPKVQDLDFSQTSSNVTPKTDDMQSSFELLPAQNAVFVTHLDHFDKLSCKYPCRQSLETTGARITIQLRPQAILNQLKFGLHHLWLFQCSTINKSLNLVYTFSRKWLTWLWLYYSKSTTEIFFSTNFSLHSNRKILKNFASMVLVSNFMFKTAVVTSRFPQLL